MVQSWQNPDGLYILYGTDQGVRGSRAGVTTGAGKHRELVLEVDLTGAARTIHTADLNNDGTLEGFADGRNTPIPTNAIIVKQTAVVVTPLAGGTNYAVGTYQGDGTVDTAAGIRTTLGADGTQIGTQLSAERYVSVVTTGTYTAGKIKIIIEYITN